MPSRYPRLRSYFKDGSRRTSEGVIMCFNMKHPHERIAKPVTRALDILLERMPPQGLTWRIDYDGQWHELGVSAWDAMRKEMLGPEKFLCLRLEGPGQDASGFYVDYRGLPLPLPWAFRARDTCVLYVRLPTEYLEEQGPEHVRTLALDMAEELPFNTGYVDLALCDVETGRDEKLLEAVSTRYLGVHLAGSGARLEVDTQVDGIHWMNFLGQPVLGQLGGVDALRQQLASLDISLHEMRDDRVLLTLGEWPEVGDVQAGETLPRHRALARILEPYLFHHKGFHQQSGSQ